MNNCAYWNKSMNKQDSVKKVMKQNFEKKDDIEHDRKEDYLQKISI